MAAKMESPADMAAKVVIKSFVFCAFSTCVCFAFFFAPFSISEFHLREDFFHSSRRFSPFLASVSLDDSFLNQFEFYCVLLLMFVAIQSFVVFVPSLRHARAFYAVTGNVSFPVRSYEWWEKLAAYLNCLLTLLLPFMWVKPLTRDFFVNDDSVLTDDFFLSLRLFLVLLVLLLRASLLRAATQSFLDHTVVLARTLSSVPAASFTPSPSSDSGSSSDSSSSARASSRASARASSMSSSSSSPSSSSLGSLGSLLLAGGGFVRARVVGAALQWTLPCVVLAALAALAAQHTDLGVCAALAGTLECATQGPNSFQDNPFLPALFNFSLMCHALTFALSYAYALIAVRPEFRK